MRNQMLFRRLSISDFAVFCFFAGILFGTAWVNLEGMEGTSGIESLLLPGYRGTGAEALSALIMKRCLFISVLWLTGISLLAVPGILFFFAWAGFSMAFLISGLTVQSGVAGLLLFVASVIPQIFFYIPVIAIVSGWAMGSSQKLHLAGFLVLLGMTAAGAAAENYISPVLFSIVSWWIA